MKTKSSPKKDFLCPHCGRVMEKHFSGVLDGVSPRVSHGPCVGLACRTFDCDTHVITLEDLPEEWQEYLSQFRTSYGSLYLCPKGCVKIYECYRQDPGRGGETRRTLSDPTPPIRINPHGHGTLSD